MRSEAIPRLIVGFLVAAVATSVAAQTLNPLEGDETALRAGSGLYAARCADCHGPDAKGNRGPDLTQRWAAGATDETTFAAIRGGVAGSIMPPSTAPDAEIWAIVAYLRSISVAPRLVSTGDAARGRATFAKECADCHRVGSAGGVIGPDLTRIGALRSREALVAAIREPSALVATRYRAVALRTRRGERTVGVVKSEDAFTIQILSADDGHLASYDKNDLAELVPQSDSLMPRFTSERLSAAQLEDLLAYLGTLREAVADSVTEEAASVSNIVAGLSDPTRWPTFSGDYTGARHSPLTQISPRNVRRLAPRWTFQSGTFARGRGFETTPLVEDGVLYVTGSNNYAWALDARTGRTFWEYRRDLPSDLTYGASAPVNRGFGMRGDRLFMVTLDAHLISLDRRTGGVLWDIELADYREGYAATLAPLVVDDKVVVGISGGEYATRGFVDAYDYRSGKRLWRRYTVPAPGEPGSDTWPSAVAAARGGGGTWMTGSYDPELGLLYWGTGNPNPDYYGANRRGDNLYTNSLLAIDAATGELRWHYQFTPHDTHDWDSNHVPVLAALPWQGRERRVVMVANRNGFFYVLDRVTGELLLGKPFTATTWAREIGADGRPIVLNEDGSSGCLPDQWGGTNFNPPSFDPQRRLFFVNARETCATFHGQEPQYVPGEVTAGGIVWVDRDRQFGALRAIDALTGEQRWEFRYPTPNMAGVMSTASGLVFSGDQEGNFAAFDAATGRLLWRYQTGASIWGAAPMTYLLDGRQYVLIPSGAALTAFALPE